MIHLIIKFLICFTKPKSGPKKEQKMSKSNSPLPSRKEALKKYSKSANKSVLEEEPPPIGNDEQIIQCPGKVREWCHIEYCIFKDVLPPIQLTVVTWGGAAKIYFEDDWRALKTVTIDDCVWVHFTMVHKIAKLNDDQVNLMKENVIVFEFSQDPRKMSSNVSNDWPKTFAVCTCKNSEGIVEKKMFCELRQTDPPDDTHNSEFAKERLDGYKMTNVGSSNKIFMANMLQLAPLNQIIENKIDTVMKTMPISTEKDGKKEQKEKKKEQVGKKVKKSSKLSIQHKTKLFGKKEQKEKKKKKEQVGKKVKKSTKLLLKSDLLIAGKTNVCVESKGISPSIRYAAIFTSASKVLTEEQDLSFIPLSVTVEEVTNISRKQLEDMNVQSVYARYELAPLIEEVQTCKVPVQSDGGPLCHAEFDDTRLWFVSDPQERARHEQLTQRPNVLQLIESLLTRRLVVKLFGVKSFIEERVVEPCLFGQRATDKFISTPGHPMFLEFKEPPVPSKEVLLGSACFNLVQLVKGMSTYEESSLLSSAPVSSWSPTCDWNELTEYMESGEERAKLMEAFSVRGALPDHVLMQNFTSVKIKVTVGCRLSNVSEKELILMPHVFHRVIIVFRNYNYARAVVDRIMSTNLTLGDPTASESVTSASVTNLVLRYTNNRVESMRSGSLMFNPSSLGSRRTLASIRGGGAGGGLPSTIVQQIKGFRRMLSHCHRAITGFFINHPAESLLVLESIPYMTNYVMEPLYSLSPADGRVVYDNSVFFTQRLYNGFDRNVLEIKLAVPLDALLARTAPYLSKNAEDRVAAQTLLLLDLLRRARTVNDASVNQLFPSGDQLIAFQMEFADGQLSSGKSFQS